jgi:signal transduction histidine kinase
MTFRNKILISIWGVVLSLLVITFFIINYWTRSRFEETFARELSAGSSTVMVQEKLQSAELIRACSVIAESPRLRAVAELGDENTAYQLLKEMNQTTLSQAVVLTDRTGRPLVQMLRGKKERWDISGSQTIQNALLLISSTDVSPIEGRIYRIVSVPVVIATELVGTLTIGLEITPGDLAALKHITNSDLVLVHRMTPILATFDSAEAISLLSAMGPCPENAPRPEHDSAATPIRLSTGTETYLGTSFRLDRSAGNDSSTVVYLIIKPLSREVRRAMASILGTFGIVSLIFLALTTVIGLVISRSMTRPISELVQGTTEISRGNYDYAISVGGKDELGILARRFLAMSSFLKEKINELGKVNRDLLERNRDLDETVRKLRSAQEDLVRSERLAATGKMTAQLAHEVNNPIHNIQSCLKTALGRLPEGTKGRDLIDVAYEEVNRLSRLSAQMLSLYRSSLVEEEMKPTNVNEILGEVVILARGEVQDRNIVLRTEIEPALPLVRGSRDKLKQVLLNLISNALDAMPGGGELAMLASRDNGSIRLTVKDNGVGIPQENLNRIFDAFYTTKGKVSGVGLGLSVSYGIVSQHRGSIEVQSTVGKGSAFTVILPSGE